MQTPTIKDALAAILRRTVAVAVGYALTWLARQGHIVLDADTSQMGVAFATAFIAAVYGAVVNWAELHVPALGWFLGLAKAPKYVNAKTGVALSGPPVAGPTPLVP